MPSVVSKKCDKRFLSSKSATREPLETVSLSLSMVDECVASVIPLK